MTAIRPPRLDRVLGFVAFCPVMIGAGIALSSVAFVPGSSARGFVLVLGVVFVGIGVWGTIRLPRVAVRLTDDMLRYDGFLMRWSVPRSGITVVLDDAFVEWRDDRGTEHRRQI